MTGDGAQLAGLGIRRLIFCKTGPAALVQGLGAVGVNRAEPGALKEARKGGKALLGTKEDSSL